MSENVFYIGIGSNIACGDRQIARAFSFLKSEFSGVRCSDVYTTDSVSRGDDSVYFNAVAECRGNMSAEEVGGLCKRFERESGRTHDAGSREVVIDLDPVIVNDIVLRSKDASRSYFLIGYRQLTSGSDHGDSRSDR